MRMFMFGCQQLRWQRTIKWRNGIVERITTQMQIVFDGMREGFVSRNQIIAFIRAQFFIIQYAAIARTDRRHVSIRTQRASRKIDHR